MSAVLSERALCLAVNSRCWRLVALMSNPRLLLLDEPSLGLAPIIIQQIFDTIEQLREQDDHLPCRAERQPGR